MSACVFSRGRELRVFYVLLFLFFSAHRTSIRGTPPTFRDRGQRNLRLKTNVLWWPGESSMHFRFLVIGDLRPVHENI